MNIPRISQLKHNYRLMPPMKIIYSDNDKPAAIMTSPLPSLYFSLCMVVLSTLKPVNKRLCAIRLQIEFPHVWMNYYAPIEENDKTVKDQFYNSLERTYGSSLKNDINSATGRQRRSKEGETHRGVPGEQFAWQQRRLFVFAFKENLIVSSIYIFSILRHS